MFDERPLVGVPAPEAVLQPETGPVPSATPSVVPKSVVPIERPAAPAPKRPRVNRPRVAKEPPLPPPQEPPPRPFAEKLARVKAKPHGDLRFDLADDVEREADRTLPREVAASVKACLTQFRITGGVGLLEECVGKFERARGSDMSP